MSQPEQGAPRAAIAPSEQEAARDDQHQHQQHQQQEQRAAFMTLLRQGVADKLQHAPDPAAQPPAWHALRWRNAYALAPFFCETIASRALQVRQLQQGELRGLGTGLTVWPAACVLLKHLEHRVMSYSALLRDQLVVELGSGTGAVGIAAAMLGAKRVVLTDMPELRFLMEENVALAKQHAPDLELDIDIAAYAWGTTPPPCLLQVDGRAPDWIVISDCVLPKLYPIAPLVDALDRLADLHTHIVISYEHRYYEHFDAKQMFWELLTAKRFEIHEIASEMYHPLYRADDIEIWEVTKLPPESAAGAGATGTA